MITLPENVTVSCKCMRCLREHRDLTLPMTDWRQDPGAASEPGDERLHAASQRFSCPCGAEITVDYDIWEHPRGRESLREYSCDGAWRLTGPGA